MARNVTSKAAANSNSAERTPAKHYMNIYFNGSQIGYAVLDDQPAIVAKAQADEGFLTRLLHSDKVTATYREAGVSSKPELDLDDI